MYAVSHDACKKARGANIQDLIKILRICVGGSDPVVLNEAKRRERSCKNARVTSHWVQIDLITERKRLARATHLVGAFGALPAFPRVIANCLPFTASCEGKSKR